MALRIYNQKYKPLKLPAESFTTDLIFSQKNLPLTGWHPRFEVFKQTCTFTAKPCAESSSTSLGKDEQGLAEI